MSVASFAMKRIFSNARTESKFNFTSAHADRLRLYWPLFVQEGARVKLSPYLLAGIAWGESDYMPRALNQTSGAAGLMQVMPDTYGGRTYQKMGWRPGDEFNPAKNVRAGADLLAYHYRAMATRKVPGRSTAHTERALASYGGFSTWLRGEPVTPGGKLDAAWYVDEAMGRAFLLELLNTAGTLQL